MRRLLVAAALAALLAVPVARADGDPASDVLYTQWVFLPFEVKFDPARQAELLATVKAARKRAYPIKVALITASYDLGAIPGLFGRPQQYAQFLGLELSFLYKHRLLIVMPDGFGIYNGGKPVTRERAVLATISIGKGPNALADAATEAVRKLAAAAGHPLPAVSVKGAKSTSGHGGLVIILAAVGGLALLAGAWLLLRRRASRR